MNKSATDAETDAPEAFSLFRYGHGGIPDMFYRQLSPPGGGERLAALVVEGALGERIAPDYLRTVAQLLVEYYGRGPEPLPSFVLEANAAALSLMSPDTGKPRPAPPVRELMGFPKGVDLRTFLYCVGCDAIALALHHLPEPGDVAIPVEALQKHVASIRCAEDWAISGAALLREKRAAMRLLREKPDYRRIAAEVGSWLLVYLCCSDTRPPAGMPKKVIRDTVMKLSRDEVIDVVDRQPTVWSTVDRSALGG